MSTLEPYIRECCYILDHLNIPYGKVRKWEINIRAKSRWGLRYVHLYLTFGIIEAIIIVQRTEMEG